jgi:hypothetical protein
MRAGCLVQGVAGPSSFEMCGRAKISARTAVATTHVIKRAGFEPCVQVACSRVSSVLVAWKKH